MKYAEEYAYFQTSVASPDTWLERTKKLIAGLGYKVTTEGFGSDESGKSAYMLSFRAGEDDFKLIWPVLPSRSARTMAARVQATTMMYHYAKAVCLFASVVGAKTAFFSHLMLPDGRVVSSIEDFERMLRMAQGSDALALPEGGAQ